MNKPKTACNQPLLRRLTLLALPALIGGMIGCGPEQQVPEPLGVAKHEVRAPSETMTPALRAAYVANVQSTASHDYAVKTTGGVLKAHNAAQRFDVEMGDTVNVRLPGDERLSFELARVGCDGELRAAGKARPVATGNRVDYVRRGGEAEDLTEWYVHGPLGLEQGFTLDGPLACGARDVVLDVGVGGSLVPTMAEQGKAVLLRNAVGRAVARYSDLYVVDAVGRELPSKLEVVGRSVRILFDERGAVYPVRVDPLVAVEQAMLLASDGQAGDEFGEPVAISGDLAAVHSDSGVYIFARVGDVWTEEAKLDSTRVSLGLSGDTLVLSSGGDVDGVFFGAVDVFVRTAPGVWQQQAKLLPSDGEGSFGASVAISGDTIATGAIHDDDLGEDVGAVYVFSRTGEIWTEEAKLYPSDPQPAAPFFPYPGGMLGTRLAMSGDTIIATEPNHVDFSNPGFPMLNVGSAYVFVKSGGAWEEQAMLTASGGGVAFGYSVDVFGDYAVVGGGSPNGPYVFARTGSTWIEEAIADPRDVLGGTPAVAISGELLAVSGTVTDDNGQHNAVHIYAREGASWVEQDAVLSDNGSFRGGSPKTLALSGDTLLAGTPDAYVNAIKTGAAYTYVLRQSNGSPCSTASECASGYCVDDVCCETLCDDDCYACSIAAGGSVDGSCTGVTGQLCDDGNACTLLDTCDAGSCVGSSPAACPSTDICHDNCDPTTGQCTEIAKPDDTPCDDGNACSRQDTCQSGACVGGDAMSCETLDVCHNQGTCDPSTGLCNNPAVPDGTPCPGGFCTDGQCGLDDNAREEPTYVVAGGCGCRLEDGGYSSTSPWLLLLLGGLTLRLRRNFLMAR